MGDHDLAAFQAARVVARRHSPESPAVLVTVQATGGAFGTTPFAPEMAWSGGVAALARTFAQEHPEAAVKAIDVDAGDRSVAALAALLADEIAAGGPELEVGLAANGRRVTLTNRLVSARRRPTANVGPSDVIVVSGGARGVTAVTVIALAKATRARFVLLGRTPLADEPPAARGVPSNDAALKAALLKDARARGEALSPRDLGKRVSTILAGREVQDTLSAIHAAGAQARYVALDVTDLAGLRALYAELAATWGPVTGIIHGAGVIRDRYIREKSDDDFQLVISTKLDGLKAMLAVQGSNPLNLLLTFSSVAARTGNVGQVDYAMANEVLNRVCDAMARQNPQAVIRSLGWGPWEAGMVTPALKARFESLGVPLIALDTGARMLVDEVFAGPGMPTSVVLGGEPKPEALLHDGNAPATVLRIAVSPTAQPWLADHTVAGLPVVPMALVVDQMLAAARALRPGVPFGRIHGLKVHNGIRLTTWPAEETLWLHVRDEEGGGLAMTLTDDNGRPRYSAQLPVGEPTADAPVPTVSAPAHKGAVYDGTLLFHGPALQVLEDDVCVDKAGATAKVMSQPLRGTSTVDVGAVDGALQLALLWAREATGGPSLPMAIDELELHPASSSDIRGLVLTGRSAHGPAGSADVVLVDADGRASATLRGVRTVRRPDAGQA